MGSGPADESLLPDFSLMDDVEDGNARGRDSLLMEANYLLLADNLLDLSHANYLHEGLLGFPEHSTADVKVSQDDANTVSVARNLSNVPVARMHDLMFRNDGAPVDMWSDIRWQAPACMTLVHGFSTPGSRGNSVEFTALHFLTPANGEQTHYMYGIVRPRRVMDDPNLASLVAEARRFAFEQQDKTMLEAQQRTLARTPSFKPVMLPLDAASVRVRRIVDQQIAQEQANQADTNRRLAL